LPEPIETEPALMNAARDKKHAAGADRDRQQRFEVHGRVTGNPGTCVASLPPSRPPTPRPIRAAPSRGRAERRRRVRAPRRRRRSKRSRRRASARCSLLTHSRAALSPRVTNRRIAFWRLGRGSACAAIHASIAPISSVSAVSAGFLVIVSSTRRRIASDRPMPLAAPHPSIAAMSSRGRRTATTGSRPVAGRPRFRILVVYIKSEPRRSANFRPGSNPCQTEHPKWHRLPKTIPRFRSEFSSKSGSQSERISVGSPAI